jgi:hypothetical protein
MIKDMSSAGIPMESKTITNVTKPACGTIHTKKIFIYFFFLKNFKFIPPAVPMEAHVAVMLNEKNKIKEICILDNFT